MNTLVIGELIETPGEDMRIRGFAQSLHRADIASILTITQAAGFRAYTGEELERTALLTYLVVWGE